MNRTILVLATALGLSACGNPMNLTYDFGRAYNSAFSAQADLSRPSVATAQHRLSGLEGTLIRLNTSAETTNSESEKSTFNTN